MAEYIEREKVIELIDYHQEEYFEAESYFGLLKEDFLRLPSADVQPVLRCKDCKEWHRNYLAIDGGKHGCELFQDFTRPDDFCSFGTRMDGET